MVEFAIHIATMAALYGLVALSLNFQVAQAGLVNFGQILLFGCGAYGLGMVMTVMPTLWAGLLAGLVFGAVVVVILGLLARRISSDYWGIATLAVAEIFRIVATNETELTGGAQGISGLPSLFGSLPFPANKIAIMALCWAIVLIVALGFRRMSHSRFGRALRVMREQPYLAQSLGYNVERLKIQALFVAAVPAVIAGLLFASYFSFVGPEQLTAPETFLIWVMIMVGGLGNQAGAVVGAALIVVLSAIVPFLKDWVGASSDQIGALRLCIVGATLLFFLLWRPQGLVPEKIVMPKP